MGSEMCIRDRLHCASIDTQGQLGNHHTLAGSRPSAKKRISVFQPLWLPDGTLVAAEDSSGWWNLLRQANHGSASASDNDQNWARPWPMQAETAMPQWVFGMRTTAWDGTHLLAAICTEGRWQLTRLSSDGGTSPVAQPFDDLADLDADAGRAVALSLIHI